MNDSCVRQASKHNNVYGSTSQRDVFENYYQSQFVKGLIQFKFISDFITSFDQIAHTDLDLSCLYSPFTDQVNSLCFSVRFVP